MWDRRDFRVARLEFEHFVLIFKAHSDYAIAGTSSKGSTKTHAFQMFINFICHQSFNVILSYVVQELSLGYLFLVTILPFPLFILTFYNKLTQITSIYDFY